MQWVINIYKQLPAHPTNFITLFLTFYLLFLLNFFISRHNDPVIFRIANFYIHCCAGADAQFPAIQILPSPFLRNLWRCTVVLTRWYRTQMFTFVTRILVCKPVKLAKWLQMLSRSKHTSLHYYLGSYCFLRWLHTNVE